MPQHIGIEPKRLEKQIDFMIQGHEFIVNLLKTPNLASKIEELNNPEVRKAAAADPLKAAKEAGLILPDKGVSIQIHDFPSSWEVEVQAVLGPGLLIIGLNSRKGFYVR